MRKPLIVANWKMNTTLSDALVMTTAIKNAVHNLEVDVVLCPPFPWLVPMRELLEHGPDNLYLGAQNMWFAEKGAMTGEVSPIMLKNLADFVILGHSERRSHFNESDDLINDKVQAALNNHLKPILCVSEYKKSEEIKRTRGRPSKDSRADVFEQLKNNLKGVSSQDISKIAIAFEPVWAISTTPDTKGAASGVYAGNMLSLLKEELKSKYGSEDIEDVQMLYGGSVDSKNIGEFIGQNEIDGVLVGGASLKANEFIKICQEASGRN